MILTEERYLEAKEKIREELAYNTHITNELTLAGNYKESKEYESKARKANRRLINLNKIYKRMANAERSLSDIERSGRKGKVVEKRTADLYLKLERDIGYLRDMGIYVQMTSIEANVEEKEKEVTE